MVTESGGRNHAIHRENSIKGEAGILTRINSQETKKATARPRNVRADNNTLYINALMFWGAPNACRQPSNPHEISCPNCEVLKLLRIRNPNGTRVMNPIPKRSRKPTKLWADLAKIIDRDRPIVVLRRPEFYFI